MDEESAPALMMAADLLLMERVGLIFETFIKLVFTVFTIKPFIIFTYGQIDNLLSKTLKTPSFEQIVVGEVNSGSVLTKDHL